MSHFNFSLSDITDSRTLSRAFKSNAMNYTPDGQKKALSTSDSKLPANESKKSLTTFNVSDILQGTAVYKPQELVYNSFNNSLSKTLSFARNTKINGRSINGGKAQMGLMGYDTSLGPQIDIGLGASALATSAASSGTGSAASSGTINVEGSAPAGIPKGPFKPAYKRYNNREWIQKTDVEEILLTGQQIIELMITAGCDLNGAVFMWALCKRESGFYCNRAGVNDNGSTDAGLWQINNGMKKQADGTLVSEYNGWRGFTIEQICDPWVNVKIAMIISNNGSNFLPWQTTGNYSSPDNSHLKGVNMEEAYNFFRENGYKV